MFKSRSTKKELLDGEVSKEDLICNLKELHTINSLLGGYVISSKAILKLKLNGINIIDIGSGGGDMLHHLYQKIGDSSACSFIGIDLKPECTAYAQGHLPDNLRFITDDYRNATAHLNPGDILHACLFTHHLTNGEIIELTRFAKKYGATLIINDLHRHPFAYYSIKLLTAIFSKSRLVKNDAPLSVLRGFKKKEWVQLLEEAGAKDYQIKWKWAFRHLIIVHG